MQMHYTARLEAIWLGRGCYYEEVQYAQFPQMASAIRWGASKYPAGVGGVIGVMGSKLTTVAVWILRENWTRSGLAIESGWR